MSLKRSVVALAGGVGGAKLAVGLQAALPPGALTVIVNTGDDFRHFGLHISPDLDTVMYNLAGIANPELGWGIADDTQSTFDMLKRYGGPAWFQLGDRDIATHITRTEQLTRGVGLTSVTASLARALGVRPLILPMTDAPVATRVLTADGELDFQDYFVARRAQPRVIGVRLAGSDTARATPEVIEALDSASLIVFCPSNPIVSLGPILSIAPIRERLRATVTRRIAVSPIIGGQAVKGPAAAMLQSLGHDVSPVGIARLFSDCLDGMVIDTQDATLLGAVRQTGLAAVAMPTLMTGASSKLALANGLLDFAATLPSRGVRIHP